MVTQSDVRGWACGLDAVLDRIGGRFGRVEPRRRAAAYLRGLLALVERKNGWQLAEVVGDRTPDGVQDFLSRVRWDADAVRDDLCGYVVEHLGDPAAVLVVDETGFLKKGTKSVGVQRQYTGTAGRIENSQVGVFLGYAGRHGQALIDRALYLPESWAKDGPRRAAARVPESVAFATKPKLALALLERAHAAGVPFAWVAGDSVYGAASLLRRWAERRRRGYVLAVTSGQRLGGRPVTAWIKGLAEGAWHRLSAGEGAKGPRRYDWACVSCQGGADGFACALLVRRSIAAPTHLTFYLTHAPDGTTLAELVRVAGARWSIESLFEQAIAQRSVVLAGPAEVPLVADPGGRALLGVAHLRVVGRGDPQQGGRDGRRRASISRRAPPSPSCAAASTADRRLRRRADQQGGVRAVARRPAPAHRQARSWSRRASGRCRAGPFPPTRHLQAGDFRRPGPGANGGGGLGDPTRHHLHPHAAS